MVKNSFSVRQVTHKKAHKKVPVISKEFSCFEKLDRGLDASFSLKSVMEA
jgi:hypothetical protein